MNTVVGVAVVTLASLLLWLAIVVLAVVTVRLALRFEKWLDRWLP